MRIVVHGQQAFGKAVLEALLKRGENVIAVFVAPEKPGAKAAPLKDAAIAAGLPVPQPASYRDEKATYECLCRAGNSKIDCGKPWEQSVRLFLGCIPAPGAWTSLYGASV